MRKAALDAIHTLAREDERVVFLGTDLGAGTLDGMRREMPERFFMEGINEQNILGVAAGLAMEGFVPYVNNIATFITRRSFEQVAVDLCLHNLPVRLLASGGGLVYAPLGATHLAIEDLALMRAVPNMTVVAPSDAEEMKRVMRASLDVAGPMYIRFGKGGDPVVSRSDLPFALGTGVSMRPAGPILLISTGIMTARVLEAADRLAEDGLKAGVLHLHTVKPLDVAQLLGLAGQADLVVTVEEHSLAGGLGSAILEVLADHTPDGRLPRIRRLGLADRFPDRYGSQNAHLAEAGLTPEGIASAVKAAFAGTVSR